MTSMTSNNSDGQLTITITPSIHDYLVQSSTSSSSSSSFASHHIINDSNDNEHNNIQAASASSKKLLLLLGRNNHLFHAIELPSSSLAKISTSMIPHSINTVAIFIVPHNILSSSSSRTSQSSSSTTHPTTTTTTIFEDYDRHNYHDNLTVLSLRIINHDELTSSSSSSSSSNIISPVICGTTNDGKTTIVTIRPLENNDVKINEPYGCSDSRHLSIGNNDNNNNRSGRGKKKKGQKNKKSKRGGGGGKKKTMMASTSHDELIGGEKDDDDDDDEIPNETRTSFQPTTSICSSSPRQKILTYMGDVRISLPLSQKQLLSSLLLSPDKKNNNNDVVQLLFGDDITNEIMNLDGIVTTNNDDDDDDNSNSIRKVTFYGTVSDIGLDYELPLLDDDDDYNDDDDIVGYRWNGTVRGISHIVVSENNDDDDDDDDRVGIEELKRDVIKTLRDRWDWMLRRWKETTDGGGVDDDKLSAFLSLSKKRWRMTKTTKKKKKKKQQQQQILSLPRRVGVAIPSSCGDDDDNDSPNKQHPTTDRRRGGNNRLILSDYGWEDESFEDILASRGILNHVTMNGDGAEVMILETMSPLSSSTSATTVGSGDVGKDDKREALSLLYGKNGQIMTTCATTAMRNTILPFVLLICGFLMLAVAGFILIREER